MSTTDFKALDHAAHLKKQLRRLCATKEAYQEFTDKILFFTSDGASDEQLLPRLCKEKGILRRLRAVFRCKGHAGNTVIKNPCHADPVYLELLEQLIVGFASGDGGTCPGGLGRAICNSLRMQGQFTKAQVRAMKDLADLIGEHISFDKEFTNMSWAPARWDSILHVLQRLLILLPQLLLCLAAEAADPESPAKHWAEDRLKLFTFANIVHLGLLAEAISAGSDFVHSACKDGGSVATVGRRAREFRARLDDLFAIKDGSKVPLVFQQCYNKGFLYMALRAIKDTKIVKYSNKAHVIGWPGDAQEICQPLGRMQNYVNLVKQGLEAEIDADVAIAFEPFDLAGWAGRDDTALPQTFAPLGQMFAVTAATLVTAYIAVRPAAERARAAGRKEVHAYWCHAMLIYPTSAKMYPAFARAVHSLNCIFDATGVLEQHFSFAEMCRTARQAHVRPAITENVVKIRIDGPAPDSLCCKDSVPSPFLENAMARFVRWFRPARVRDRAGCEHVPKRDAGTKRGHTGKRTFAKLLTERADQLATLRADAQRASDPVFGTGSFSAVTAERMREQVDIAAKASWTAAQTKLHNKFEQDAKRRRIAQTLDALPIGQPARLAKLAEMKRKRDASAVARSAACVFGASALGLPSFTAQDKGLAIFIQSAPGVPGERERNLAAMIRDVAAVAIVGGAFRVVHKLCDIYLGVRLPDVGHCRHPATSDARRRPALRPRSCCSFRRGVAYRRVLDTNVPRDWSLHETAFTLCSCHGRTGGDCRARQLPRQSPRS